MSRAASSSSGRCRPRQTLADRGNLTARAAPRFLTWRAAISRNVLALLGLDRHHWRKSPGFRYLRPETRPRAPMTETACAPSLPRQRSSVHAAHRGPRALATLCRVARARMEDWAFGGRGAASVRARTFRWLAVTDRAATTVIVRRLKPAGPEQDTLVCCSVCDARETRP